MQAGYLSDLSLIYYPKRSTVKMNAAMNLITCSHRPKEFDFLELPPEIRNAIYEYAVAGTRLVYDPTRLDRRALGPIGLIVVSRQVRKEAYPMLLATASLVFKVEDFNFPNIASALQMLSTAERKAIHSNEDITVRLLLQHRCRPTHVDKLELWLQRRTLGLTFPSVHYAVAWEDYPYSDIGIAKLQRRRQVASHLEMLSRLYYNLDEALRDELEPVIAAFEEASDALTAGVSPAQDEDEEVDK